MIPTLDRVGDDAVATSEHVDHNDKSTTERRLLLLTSTTTARRRQQEAVGRGRWQLLRARCSSSSSSLNHYHGRHGGARRRTRRAAELEKGTSRDEIDEAQRRGLGQPVTTTEKAPAEQTADYYMPFMCASLADDTTTVVVASKVVGKLASLPGGLGRTTNGLATAVNSKGSSFMCVLNTFVLSGLVVLPTLSS